MNASIYTDPYSGREILLVEAPGGNVGIAYDPRRTDPPVPWSSCCRHCQRGRHRELPPQARREIVLLLSRRDRRHGSSVEHLYEIPTNSQRSMGLNVRARGRRLVAVVTKRSPRQILRLVKEPLLAARVTAGDPHSFQSPVLWRCLKFLFSRRNTSRAEAAACLHPLLNQPRKKRTPGGRHLRCREIDWAATIGAPP